MTRGTLPPGGTGTLLSVNIPLESVVVLTTGFPVTGAQPQSSVAGKGAGVLFGTYTKTFGTGSGLPYAVGVPATTCPERVVVPASQVFWSRQRPVHAGLSPHTPGCPPPPQMSLPVHVSPQSSTPPQPSAAGPQLKPSARHVVGTHAVLLPHW